MLESAEARAQQKVSSLGRSAKEEQFFVPEVSEAVSKPLEVSHSTIFLQAVYCLPSKKEPVLSPLRDLGRLPIGVTALFGLNSSEAGISVTITGAAKKA